MYVVFVFRYFSFPILDLDLDQLKDPLVHHYFSASSLCSNLISSRDSLTVFLCSCCPCH